MIYSGGLKLRLSWGHCWYCHLAGRPLQHLSTARKCTISENVVCVSIMNTKIQKANSFCIHLYIFIGVAVIVVKIFSQTLKYLIETLH